MKRIVLITVILTLTSALAFAKVDISGSLRTQWRVQQMEQRVNAGSNGEVRSKKVYEVDAFDIVIDAQVSDRVTAGAVLEFRGARRGESGLAFDDVSEAWIAFAFGAERLPYMRKARTNRLFPVRLLNLKIGKFGRPFGEESGSRGIFATKGVPSSSNNALADTAGNVINTGFVDDDIIGAMISGDIDMLSYGIYVSNTSLGSMVDTDIANPGNKNAKAYGLNLRVEPVKGLKLGADYELSTYGSTLEDSVASKALADLHFKKRRATGWNINAGYDFQNQLKINGEYGQIKHNALLPGETTGVTWGTADATASRQQAKFSYYVLSGVYHGINDWAFGVRVSDIKAQNTATENWAGYAGIRQYQYAVQYTVSANTVLKGEFSQRKTRTIAANPSEPRDHVYTLQMAVKF